MQQISEELPDEEAYIEAFFMDIKITFQPFNKSVFFSTPVTLIEAVRTAGLHLRGSCNGQSRCGKCKVKILSSNRILAVTPEEMKFLTEQEVKEGVRLACFFEADHDLEVAFIEPSEGMVILSHFKPVPFHLNPLIRFENVEVSKPILSDVRGDMEGIWKALGGKYQIGLDVLTRLPIVLRKGNWAIDVSIWDNKEIIRIESESHPLEGYGLAIDLGTTTVVIYLYDLTDGKQVGYLSFVNPQITMGEDVMTRISYSLENPEGLYTLHETLKLGLNSSIHKLCKNCQIDPLKVDELTIVGNTIMHHLLLGIPVAYVGKAPFPPVLQHEFDLHASDLGLDVNPMANVHMLPLIGGFVGSDHVGAILAADIFESTENHLLIDIGTNGEITLGNRDTFLCCSVAAGPAFEGGHLKHGMRAVEGAIDSFEMDDSSTRIKITTVGNVPPIGICGSGYLDILSEMLRLNYLSPKGRINPKIKAPRIRKGLSGLEFVVVWSGEKETHQDIVITSDDIQELQMAKGAISCGIKILMEKRKVDEVGEILLAGAFGNYLRPEAAKAVGLIPKGAEVVPIGNAAGYGAILALLSREKRLKAQEIAKKIKYIELASEPLFQDKFMEAIPFPNQE